MENSTQTKRIVCIGGGTGTFVALKGLKFYPYHLSAIVAMSDSGGSNRRLRDEFGLLPTSDIRQCLVALSDENGGVGLLRKLFMYRFSKGKGIRGMTFGNLFMAALADILGSQADAIRQTEKVLRIRGSVIPVSYTRTNLFATYEDGRVVSEEHLIDEPRHDGRLKITGLMLKPKATANGEAVRAIQRADMVLLGPGDLFTSLLPNLLVDGIADAIRGSKAKKVYVMNLMTKYGQTYDFRATDHIRTLEQYIGKSIDTVLINTAPIPQRALQLYAKHHEHPVIDDMPKTSYYHVIGEHLINPVSVTKPKADRLVRSLIRHDSGKLSQVLVSVLEGKR